MRNILVTGGAGFIGSNFIRTILLEEPDCKVINLDLLTYSGSLENLKNLPDENRYTFVQGDICDDKLIESILFENQIDTIVHFAAESHVDRSITGPKQFIQTNIVGTFTLLEVARKYLTNNQIDPFRFHHISTDEVFGTLEPGEPPWNEQVAYSPNSPYAASKASSDHLVRAYGHTYGFPFTITNTSNNYGPYQFPEKLIPLTILNALKKQSIPIYGDGQQLRDWIHVQDHCVAIICVLKNGRIGQSYNIGGGNQPTNLTVVNMICDIIDEIMPENISRRTLIKYVKDRPGHDRRYALDSTKVHQELGWKPKYNFQEGMRQTIEWYLSNTDWIESILKQNEYNSWISKNYENR